MQDLKHLLPQWLKQLAEQPLAAKILRFAATGAVSSLVFGLVTLAALHGLSLSPLSATLTGYLAVLPLSFMGHRRLTFRSDGVLAPEFGRFCVSFIAGLLASLLAMHAVTAWMGLTPVYGIALAILVVPVISFVIMSVWVFRP